MSGADAADEVRVSALGAVEVPGEAVVLVATDLVYRSRDPLAVTMVLRDGEGGEIAWTFAWDLLVQGQTRPAGEGDVRVRPLHHRLLRCVEVALAPTFAVRVRIPAPELDAFLAAVRGRAARDAEHVAHELDAELAVIVARP